MTVSISKPALNLRRELARGAEAYSEQKFYFDGLVTNGTFDADTDWTKDTGWTISGGQALFTSQVSGTPAELSHTLVVSPNTKYVLTWEVVSNSIVTNELYVKTGNAVNSPYGYDNSSVPNGFTSSIFTTGNVTSLDIGFRINGNINSGDTLVLDNISVFNTDANDDVIHIMPKGWKPKDVFEDGLLQREGSSHDYEVVFDGFDYVVKPTVAPTATTETAVIGVKS